MARVHPVSEEVWDFRCFDPKPGIRAFGHFAEKDTFVALTWDFRENVDWAGEVSGCIEAWRALFGDLPPFKGTNLNDYLSHNFSAG